MSKNDGGSAFPVPGHSWEAENGRDWRDPVKGLSVRDYFAAAALPAVIRACAMDPRSANETHEQYFSRKAYICADAMLAERAK